MKKLVLFVVGTGAVIVAAFLFWSFVSEGNAFYGEVTDQYGHPVPRVKLAYAFQERLFGLGAEHIKVLTTDRNGQFRMTDVPGHTIAIDGMWKDGYVFGHNAFGKTFYYYSGNSAGAPKFQPNANIPVLFQAWKIEAVAKLQHEDIAVHLPADGFFHWFAMKDTAAKVGIRLVEAGDKQDRHGSVSIRIKNGQIMSFNGSGNSPMMYLAPRDGYQPGWSESFKKGSGHLDQSFYFTSDHGQAYGKLNLRLMPWYETVNDRRLGSVQFQYWVNTHGSRNLLSKDQVQHQELRLCILISYCNYSNTVKLAGQQDAQPNRP